MQNPENSLLENEPEDLKLAKQLAGAYFVEEMSEIESYINNMNLKDPEYKDLYRGLRFDYAVEQSYFNYVQDGRFFEEVEIKDDSSESTPGHVTSSVYNLLKRMRDVYDPSKEIDGKPPHEGLAKKMKQKQERIGKILEAIERLK
ncbi:MAG: hypothetical protein Q7S10_02210 [bacterium]|nr:hypothetical protein [bacterium]